MFSLTDGDPVATSSVGVVGSLLGQVMPLALAAMITPTLFALQVLVVSGPRWQTRAMAVVLGSAVVFGGYFALILAGMSQLPDAGTGRTSQSEYVIELVLGALLLAAAVWLLRPHKRVDDAMRRKVESYSQRASVWVFAGIAAYMAFTDFSTVVLLLAALHDVTRSPEELLTKAIVVATVFALVLVPVLLPPAVARFGGEGATRALQRFYAWLMSNQLAVMGVVAGFIGLVLIWRGANGLF